MKNRSVKTVRSKSARTLRKKRDSSVRNKSVKMLRRRSALREKSRRERMLKRKSVSNAKSRRGKMLRKRSVWNVRSKNVETKKSVTRRRDLKSSVSWKSKSVRSKSAKIRKLLLPPLLHRMQLVMTTRTRKMMTRSQRKSLPIF